MFGLNRWSLGLVAVDPRHGRDQGGLRVDLVEMLAYAATIFDQAGGVPVNVAVPVEADLAGQINLARNFSDLAAILGAIDANSGDAGPLKVSTPT